jgi:hypothetical protein
MRGETLHTRQVEQVEQRNVDHGHAAGAVRVLVIDTFLAFAWAMCGEGPVPE